MTPSRALAPVLGVCALAGASLADTPRDTPAAIEVDRDTTPPGRPELGFDGGGPLDGWGISLSFGWLERPIVLGSSSGAETAPVERRQTLALGGAVALGSSALVDLRFPFSHQIGDRLRLPSGGGDPRPLDRWVPGDLRLGGRIRVVTKPHGAAFIRAELTLPTGDNRDFAGEASWALAWSLIGRFALPHGITIAAQGGIRLRGAEVLVADRLVGDELFGGVGIVVPLPPIRPLWCVADQVKLTAEAVGFLGDDVGIAKGPSPAELRVGLVTRPLPELALGIRVGTGIHDDIGAPRWRALVELTYQGRGSLMPSAPPTEPDAEPALDDDEP